MPPPAFRYHAFISYAQADNRELGRHWAGWLHHALETYEVPGEMVGKRTPAGPVPGSLVPVFQEALEVSADAKLEPGIREALEQSRTLIVIGSPHAAQARHVAEEIRYFKQLGRDRVLVLLIAGDPESEEPGSGSLCFPDTLRYDVRKDGSLDREWRVHPVVADAREGQEEGYTTAAALLEALEEEGIPRAKARDRADAYRQKLNAARQKIIAGVLGVPYPELARREGVGGVATARRGHLLGRWIVLLLAIGIGAALWFAWRANEERLDANDARRHSDQLLAWLQSDLSGKLSASQQLLALSEANERFTQHFALAAEKSGDGATLGALADALADGAEIASARANYPGAASLAGQALQARERALATQDAPTGSEQRLIGDHRRVAQALLKGAKKIEALKEAEKARSLAADLVKRKADDPDALRQLVGAAYECGDMLADAGQKDEAKKAVEDGYHAAQNLAAAQQGNTRFHLDVAQGEFRFGKLLQQRGDFEGAVARYQAWKKIVSTLLEGPRSDSETWLLRGELASAHAWLGSALLLQRKFPEAATEQRSAMESSARLAEQFPGNANWHFDYATACRRLAENLLRAGPENKTEVLTLLERAEQYLDRHFKRGETAEQDTLRVNLLRADIKRLRDEAAQ